MAAASGVAAEVAPAAGAPAAEAAVAASDTRTPPARLALVAIGLVLLSACRVRLEMATEVEEDGSGEIAVTVLLGETVRDTLNEGGLVTQDPEELQALLETGGEEALYAEDLADPVDVLERDVPEGWRHERIREGRLEGLRLRAAFESVDEIPALLGPFADWGDEVAARTGRDAEQIGVVTLTRGFSLTRDGPVFRFRAEPTAEAYEGATGGPNNLLATLTVSLKLPGGVREHDADEEHDGTLVWRISPGTSRTISATSDLTYDPSSEFPVAAIAAGGGLVVAGLIAALVVRRRRRASSRSDDGPAPPDAIREEVPAPV